MLMEVVTVLVCVAAFAFLMLEKPLKDSDLPVRELTTEFLAELQVPTGINWLKAQQYRCLVAVCDTFVPSFILPEDWHDRVTSTIAGNSTKPATMKGFLPSPKKEVASFFERSASEVDVASVLANIIENVIPSSDRTAMGLLLFILSNRAMCFPLTGYLTSFQELPFLHRQHILQTWRDSKLQPIRKAYQALKRLTGAIYLSFPDPNTHQNPSWKALQYEPRTSESVKKEIPGFAPAPHLNNLISAADLTSAQNNHSDTSNPAPVTLNCDVVVIGSGCGGGVVAEMLTKAGLNVIVVDKGGHFTEEDFARWTEFEALQHTFEQQGVFSSSDGNVAILAGSCVGGGSVINWGASFRTPAHVRREWVERFGLDAFKQDGEFDEALDFICQRLNVNVDYSHRNDVIPGKDGFHVNLNNELLYQGATRSGNSCKPIPRNVKSCVNCGSCNLGCAYQAKQSTLLAFLQQVKDEQNLKIIPWTHVDRVLVENGRSVGVTATAKFPHQGSTSQTFPDNTWQSMSLTIRSTIVVSAAGALHTPALLLRSGLKHRKLGKHLSLHPVLGVGGLVPNKDTGLNQGVSMGTYVDDFISMNNTGYGIVPETPPIHPSILGLGMPWDDAVKYRYALTLYKHFAVFINISRDRSQESNQITIDSKGAPVYHYSITPEDEKVLLEGQAATMRLMRASGSKIVMGFKEAGEWYCSGDDDDEFEEYIKHQQAEGVKPNRTLVFSAHQMGSCRLSSRVDDGPLKPNGETWEVSNLFVADASTLPTSLGVNPMVTIEAVAYMVGKKVLQKLNVPAPPPDLVVPGQEFPTGPTLHGKFGNVDPSKIQW